MLAWKPTRKPKNTGFACCRCQQACATSTQDLFLDVDETYIHLNVIQTYLQKAAVIKYFISVKDEQFCVVMVVPPGESMVSTLKFRPCLFASLKKL